MAVDCLFSTKLIGLDSGPKSFRFQESFKNKFWERMLYVNQLLPIIDLEKKDYFKTINVRKTISK